MTLLPLFSPPSLIPPLTAGLVVPLARVRTGPAHVALEREVAAPPSAIRADGEAGERGEHVLARSHVGARDLVGKVLEEGLRREGGDERGRCVTIRFSCESHISALKHAPHALGLHNVELTG